MFLKIILPLFIVSTIHCYTIIIDPGHGGKFHGGKGYDNLIEKDLNLDIAKRLVSLLEKNKFKVVLTRNKDIELDKNMIKDLKIRSEICKKEKADLFISIHFNHGGSCLSGFEVYVPRCKKFPWQSYCAANHIHFELSKFTEPHWCGSLGNLNDNDRGIRAANFHVLRDQHCPAVLVELEYISNKHCAQKIKTEKFKQDLSNALSRGIINFVLEKS